MDKRELVELIIDDLVGATDLSRDFRDARVDKRPDRRTTMIARGLGDVASLSRFGIYDGRKYYFTGKIYEPIEDAVLRAAIKGYLLRCGIPDDDWLPIPKWKTVMVAFYDALTIDCELHPKYNIQAYQNGVVDLSRKEFYEFDPKYHVFYLHSYPYNPEARCPKWHQFLRQVLPEAASRAILQQYLGLCTLDRGEMTDKVENCLMLYGAGSNGKSVILEVVRGIFGDENVSGAGLMDMIKGTYSKWQTLKAIGGKAINVCPEIQARDISGYEDAFKSLCSGEPQQAWDRDRKVIYIKNIPRLIFNMNCVPKAEDASYGFFRRFLYLVFEVVIPEQAQNRHLAADLRDEFPGILNWILRGALQLKRNHYFFPESGNNNRMMLRNIAQTNITLSWFKARRIRLEPGIAGEIENWINASDLYSDLCYYARANDFAVCTMQKFGAEMRALGLSKDRGNKRRMGADGIQYRIYGFKADNIGKDVPIVADLEIPQDQEHLGYDPEDV